MLCDTQPDAEGSGAAPLDAEDAVLPVVAPSGAEGSGESVAEGGADPCPAGVRAKLGDANTFAGRRPPKDPVNCERFMYERMSWNRHQTHLKVAWRATRHPHS